MGQDKALLKLFGETLAARAVRRLRTICTEVAIAGGAPELRHLARIIPDERPHLGPLGGIVAALAQTPYEWNIVLAVDLPFVPAKLFHDLLGAISPETIAILPKNAGQPHPLCALYSRQALPGLRAELDAGRLKLISALEAAGQVQYLDFPEHDWFQNLNTPADLATARA